MTRDATPNDAEAISALLKPYVESKVLLKRSLDEIRANADKTVVYADNGRLIGTVSLVFFSDSLCEIRALVTVADAQKAGVGRRLVEAAETKALSISSARPLKFFALTYTPEFFERVGYRRTVKEAFPEKIYEVCNFCLRRDDCHEIAVEKIIA